MIEKVKNFLDCYNVRVGLDFLNESSRANYSEPFLNFLIINIIF
jgi:hypothetical protein